jgi:hypothetical protein
MQQGQRKIKMSMYKKLKTGTTAGKAKASAFKLFWENERTRGNKVSAKLKCSSIQSSVERRIGYLSKT